MEHRALAERMKDWRTRCGISQEELARLIHQSRSYIGNIESDNRVVTPEYIAAFHPIVATYLGRTEYLLWRIVMGMPTALTDKQVSKRMPYILWHLLSSFEQEEIHEVGTYLFGTYQNDPIIRLCGLLFMASDIHERTLLLKKYKSDTMPTCILFFWMVILFIEYKTTGNVDYLTTARTYMKKGTIVPLEYSVSFYQELLYAFKTHSSTVPLHFLRALEDESRKIISLKVIPLKRDTYLITRVLWLYAIIRWIAGDITIVVALTHGMKLSKVEQETLTTIKKLSKGRNYE